MKTLLVIMTWLHVVGPQVEMQWFDDPASCRAALEPLTEMIRQQARTNLIGAHGELQLLQESGVAQNVLLTGTVGREVARLRCV